MNYIHDTYTAVGGRANNEDAYITSRSNTASLYVVADGLGGHQSGEVASRLAVAEIKKIFDADSEAFDPVSAIKSANEKILQEQRKTGIKMKTTVVLAYIASGKVTFAHVGDSRAYAFQGENIVYQSKDHSAAQVAVLIGEISANEIRFHEDRNVLTRALGADEDVKVEVVSLPINQVEAVSLCSDGFWEYIYEEDMIKTLSFSKRPDEWLYKMREIVDKNRSLDSDNHTVITIMKEDEKYEVL